MAQPEIEVCATPTQPLGMSEQRFLRIYWQKRPLLVRGLFAGHSPPMAPNDLAGLACEEAALARVVTRDLKRDRWTVRSGPFDEADFAKLGRDHWTLLVQDVDKWDADVAALLDRFGFIPSWRIDDVMVSYATNAGGVGPHVDQYDVFLVQGAGQRRWQISTDAAAPREFRHDSELKLLRRFDPTHEWTLQPGDALYLPPGIPHDGVAIGQCMTYSIGMRAPARSELLLDLAEFLADSLNDAQRYADPDLQPARDPNEIDAAALQRLRVALPQLAGLDTDLLAQWFGRFITRYRSAQLAVAPGRALSPDRVRDRLSGSILMRNPFSRFAWRRSTRQAQLFVAGDSWSCPAAFAKYVAARREIDGAQIASLVKSPSALQTLTALINAGHLQFARRRKSRGDR